MLSLMKKDVLVEDVNVQEEEIDTENINLIDEFSSSVELNVVKIVNQPI